SGSLWDSYDWADRPPREGGVDDWKNRKLHAPGTHYKYNDVRVNVLAYSLLQVLRKPLPAVLKEHIMDPIGASSTWRWFGYENSWVNVDGQWMQSVSGGGHSGGGVFISTEDHARFGLLFLAQGKWKEQQLFPKNWVDKVVQPAAANPNYGMMWWLNNPKGSNYIPEISDKMYYAAGFGGNFIFVFPEEDMVVVTRWLEPRQRAAFLKKLAAALN
ncbi:MAG: serine hydrolase, partial [Flavobacteriales bacterium]